MDTWAYIRLSTTIIYPLRNLFAIGIGVGAGAAWIGSLVHANVAGMLQVPLHSQQQADFLMKAAAANFAASVMAGVRGGLFTRMNQYLYAKTQRRIFETLCWSSMETWDRLSEQDLTKVILTDLSEVVNTSSLMVNITTRSVVAIVAIFWRMGGISRRLQAICMTICSLHVLAAHMSHAYLNRYVGKTNAIKTKQETHINEYIQQHVALQLYSLQPVYMAIYEDDTAAHALAIRQEAAAYAIAMFCNTIFPKTLEIIFMMAVVHYGQASRVIELVAYYHIAIDAVYGIKDMIFAFNRTKENAVRVQRALGIQRPSLAQLLPPILPSKSKTVSDHSIRFEGISFTSPTSTKPVFDEFNLTIGHQEMVAIVATSGGGKSTLLKLLLNMYPIQTGKIWIGSRNVTDIPVATMKGLIAIVPQDALFFSQKTLRENILLSSSNLTNEQLGRILTRVHLTDFVGKLEDRLADMSGGQKQRLAIARALASQAPIVVFDEPTSYLDEATAGLLMAEIHEHCRGKTVIFITHNTSLITDQMRVVRLRAFAE